jgi:DNA-binding XRE family transcriptional regulator
MKIFYDGDRDYAEVFFKKTENYAEELDDRVTVFKSEKSDKVVGYAFEQASTALFEESLLTPSVKLAALLRILRSKEGLTQEQAAKKAANITFRHYQRLESGKENPTLETVASMMAAFPMADFSVILRHKSSAA